MCFWLMWMKDTKSQNAVASLLQSLLPSHAYPLQTDSETINSTSVFLLSFQPYTRKNVSPWLKWCYTFKTCFFLATADTLSGLLSADWLIAPVGTELCPWQRSAMHGNGVLSLAAVCYVRVNARRGVHCQVLMDDGEAWTGVTRETELLFG